MKKVAIICTILFLTVMISGCTGGSRHSNRRTGKRYSIQGFEINDSMKMRAPSRLAVVCVDSFRADEKIIDTFKAESNYFYSVITFPHATNKDAVINLTALRQTAQRQGADYLFVYGSGVNIATHDNILSIMDMTIVGKWLVPGQTINAHAEAIGAMIDIKSGATLFQAYGQDKRKTVSPTALTRGTRSNVGGRQIEKVHIKLVEDALEKIQTRVSRR